MQLLPDAVVNPTDPAKPEDAPARARMFYTAYFRKGAASRDAADDVFLQRRSGVGDHVAPWDRSVRGAWWCRIPSTNSGAPYTIVDNPYSLLDVTDMVFIDMPGAGFSRIQGKDKREGLPGGWIRMRMLFERFVRRFLTKYDRWNSPKYLFGESYGTPRSAVLSALFEERGL